MAKNRLGRGLSAIFGDTVIDNNEIVNIPVDSILPNPHQPRTNFSEDELRELANSIKEKGVLQPIIVRRTGEEEFEIVAGERRVRASKLAGLSTIPAIIKEIKDEESFEIALIENIHRSNLNPVEEAMAYKTLMEKFGYTQEKLAEKIGKDRTTVSNTLRLLSLPHQVITMLKNGDITAGHARALLSLKDEEKALEMAKEIKRKKLSVRETEKVIYTLQNETVKHYEKQLSELLNMRVKINFKHNKGRVEIHFTSEEELRKLLRTFSR